MTERRYNEAEVASIFERATEAQQAAMRHLPSSDGLTLAELEQIGREVGVAPELVAQAAKALDRVGQPTSRRFLGLPIGVGRTVDLGRRLTDDEWERLVVDLRETFDARGTVKADGSLRQWTNGNLQALLEPTESGQRVRLRTMKGVSLAYMMAGLGAFGIGAVTLIVPAVGAAVEVSSLGFFVLGAGLFAVGALRLPGWARRRREQMEGIALRLALPRTAEDREAR